ncbi:MAG: type II toxin-antitoxin system Phd/YefM family antitoxin [Coriobacteriales bacterium]|jgi:prevent-host-death family protein|nr:type II toxin-antitoxin system Phd/YefM family antitoxin [Coriobacteriales bacterium]
MTSYQVAEAKSKFSALLKEVEQGNEVMITRGKRHEPVAVMAPVDQWKRSKKRRLGTLEHWGAFTFADDWHMSDEELLES